MELSEEEKKAIEWLENAKFFSARLYAPIILNLIDQYKKEIEELKKQNYEIVKELKPRVQIDDTEYIERNFISKDKVKEKIEDYNNELEHIKNGEEFENEKPMYYWGKIALEELLEENDE